MRRSTDTASRSGRFLLCLAALFAILSTGQATATATELASIEELTGRLGDPDPRTRLRAIRQLGDAGPGALPALPVLLAMPAQPGNQEPAYLNAFRHHLARCLGRIGPGAVPALIEVLEQADQNTRIVAAGALAEAGPAAREAVPALLELTLAEDFELRYRAYAALGQIGPAAAAAVPRLIGQFRSGDAVARELAADALAAIGTPDALRTTRLYRLQRALQRLLFLPFIGFMLVPGMALIVPAVLLVPYLRLRRRPGFSAAKLLLLAAIAAWTGYGMYETALALYWSPGAVNPIRVDLLLLVPLLYLLPLLALLAGLWGRLAGRGK